MKKTICDKCERNVATPLTEQGAWLALILKRKKVLKMNDAWKRIFKKHIDCYEAIETLSNNGILDEEEKAVHEHNLLSFIIEDMKCEIDE